MGQDRPFDTTARDWWNSWADDFQAAGDIDVAVAWGPGAPEGDDLGLLGDVSGQDVVELGCGGGQFGLALSERGANVIGVDVSEAQLDHARSLAAERDQDVAFVEASVTHLPMLADASFDLAVSAFAFQWVADLPACFAEAHRILRDGGRLVFSVDHPFYKLFDPETREFRSSYFGDEPRREYVEVYDAEMVVHARRVSQTVRLLTEAGFSVEAIREPGYADPDEYVSDFGGFEPDLMAHVPPTIVYAAEK